MECSEHLRSLGAKDVQKIDMSVRTPVRPQTSVLFLHCRHRAVQEFKEGLDVWSSLLAASGGPTFSELLGNGKPVRSSLELLKWIVPFLFYLFKILLFIYLNF
jgi:hypothetical protein